MRDFAVIREPGPGWDAWGPMREQAKWDEHAAFMNALVDEGVVVLGGIAGCPERYTWPAEEGRLRLCSVGSGRQNL